jgi:putative two-component system response regulator
LRSGALTSQPKSVKESCQYLVAQRGSRYDPLVVDYLKSILLAEELLDVDEFVVPSSRIREGMVLTRDVTHPTGFVLLSKSTRMTRRLIDQLAAADLQLAQGVEVWVKRESPKVEPPQPGTPPR